MDSITDVAVRGQPSEACVALLIDALRAWRDAGRGAASTQAVAL